MEADFVQKESLLLLLLLFVAVFAGAARRLRVPYPILLTIIGGLLGLAPVFPNIALQPNLVFFVFLPPLLFAAGWQLSWREFRANLGRIFALAVGLVLFSITVLVVARTRILPGFDARSALLLGAIVGATDAVAATAIAKRFGLPRRVVDILEAESLVNDGTGLLAFQFGLAIVISGHAPSVFEGVGKLFYLSAGGIGVGLLAGLIVSRLEQWIDDGPIEIVVSLLICYAVYIFADRVVHTSGVLAVIACSMFLSRESHRFMSPEVRLQFSVVWDVLTFVLNGVVFILIGLQLPFVLGQLSHTGVWVLLRAGAVFCAAVTVLRLIWIFGETYVAYWYRKWRRNAPIACPEPKELLVLTWGGMRGVLSLAAAFSVPYALADGTPFAQRSMIVYLTFCLIGTSLVLQGLSMPWLVRALSIGINNEDEREERYARRALAEDAIRFLNQRRLEKRFTRKAIRELLSSYDRRLRELPLEPATDETYSRKERDMLLLEVVQVERNSLLSLRDDATISDDVARIIQRDLDLLESHIHTGSSENALRNDR